MLRQSCLLLGISKRRQTYATKLRRRFRNNQGVSLRQTVKQREDTIDEILRTRPGVKRDLPDTMRRKEIERELYGAGARLDREGLEVNKLYALQGLGDLEPLRNSTNFGIQDRTTLKYDDVNQMAKYEAPPVPYTNLASRKLAEGKFWPSAPPSTAMTSKEIPMLRHEKNMSPSALRFSTEIEYYLRRNLRACPAHIGENIDFAQLIIKEAIASRRSHHVYIVWTTVHPGARFEIEPHLLRLNYWVRRIIMKYIKNRPHIPRVEWVYDGGHLQRELPRELKESLTAQLASSSDTMADRVKYLKKMDSMNVRMKSIPWFMPYLWSKDKKQTMQKQMSSDFNEVQERKKSEAQSAMQDPQPAFTR
jgi:hypothetical protein